MYMNKSKDEGNLRNPGFMTLIKPKMNKHLLICLYYWKILLNCTYNFFFNRSQTHPHQLFQSYLLMHFIIIFLFSFFLNLLYLLVNLALLLWCHVKHAIKSDLVLLFRMNCSHFANGCCPRVSLKHNILVLASSSTSVMIKRKSNCYCF